MLLLMQWSLFGNFSRNIFRGFLEAFHLCNSPGTASGMPPTWLPSVDTTRFYYGFLPVDYSGNPSEAPFQVRTSGEIPERTLDGNPVGNSGDVPKKVTSTTQTFSRGIPGKTSGPPQRKLLGKSEGYLQGFPKKVIEERLQELLKKTRVEYLEHLNESRKNSRRNSKRISEWNSCKKSWINLISQKLFWYPNDFSSNSKKKKAKLYDIVYRTIKMNKNAFRETQKSF